jgi:hypothetical protein
MLLKPKSITGVGIIQFFLALSFVIWLLFFPDTGGQFAWPVTPRLTAMFIGTSFILRTFLGWKLWREKYWYRLRWSMWGNLAFLATILLATFWHVDELNWKSNIWVAHIWVLAYILEPLMLPLLEPRGAETNQPLPDNLAQGPLLPGLKNTMIAIYLTTFTLGALLMINPAFMDTRWPWLLDPFNARVMASWPMGCGAWALGIYFSKDWAEVKPGVQMLTLYSAALFIVWLLTYSSYDPARTNRLTLGLYTGVIAALLAYYYWRQERQRANSSAAP